MHAPLDAHSISLRRFFPQSRIVLAGDNGSPPDRDIRVETLCSDSRRVRPGDLFVALMGARRDGHDYVEQAVDNGAAAVLTERLLPLGIPQCVVSDTRHAHARLCLQMAGRPERQLRVAGVAGAAGKTVTSLLTASILNAAGRRVGLTSSIGYSDSEDLGAAHQTTPRSPQIATWLARMAENGCQDAVLEFEHDALADRRASAVPLDTAVLTNLGQSPRDADCGGLACDGSFRREARLLEQLKDDGVVVLNADDARCRQLLPKLRHGVIAVGMRNDADITAKVLERNRGEQLFLLRAGAESVPVRTRMLGDFHVQNCLLAAAVGLRLQLPLEDIVRGLESLDRVPGRLDRVAAGQASGVFLDASAEAATLAANLRELRRVTPGRVICVFGAHPAEDESVCAARGRVVERGADYGIITGRDLQTKASLQTMHDVLDGWQQPASAHLIPCRQAAIQWAIEQAGEDDTVLVAGASAVERSWIAGQLRAAEPSSAAPGDAEAPVIYRVEDYR